MIARARLWPEARQDIDSLPTTAHRVAAVEALLALQDNPWLGEELRQRARVGDLAGLRRIAFDTREWNEKPRYRLVHRSEPDDGVLEVVAVIAVGLRERLAAYKEAASRLRAERRRRLLDSE